MTLVNLPSHSSFALSRAKPLKQSALLASVVALGAFTLPAAQAADWSVTEMHFQYGELDTPTFVNNASVSSDTRVITLQNASGWKYGDTFFFVDYLDDDNGDSFNNGDFYGEIYLNFSMSKIFDRKFRKGGLSDIGFLLGVNAAADAKVLKYLPGVRLSWDVPGFAFLNTDFTAYIDDSDGVTFSGAPTEDDSYMLDINWMYPFEIGNQQFNIQGHIEFIGARTNEFGEPVKNWVLAQPQIRWDMGNAMFNQKNQLFVGIEYQYWNNKLGDANTDESAVQLLVVWQF
nr:hypothetical protein [Flocculibacter collagenilyticus]